MRKSKKELNTLLERISRGEEVPLSGWDKNDLADLFIRSKGFTWTGKKKADLEESQLRQFNFEEKTSNIPRRRRSRCG